MKSSKKEKPKHLGRGLESLLGPITSIEKEVDSSITPTLDNPKPLSDKVLRQSGFVEIDIDKISTNPYQPRTHWNETDLEELANSIRANGIIQPIVVRMNLAGEYELITGERRFRAAKMIGMSRIPALLRKANDEQMLELALVENIQRKDLNPIDRAIAYRNYLDTFGLTQTEAAERLGENRSVVANHLRLLDLPREIQEMLISGDLTTGHAKAILSLNDDDTKHKLANKAMAGRLSVREVENLARKILTGQSAATTVRSKPSHIEDLENKLTSLLGTKVLINTNKNGYKGKITIEFYSLDEFDRITDRLGLSALEEV